MFTKHQYTIFQSLVIDPAVKVLDNLLIVDIYLMSWNQQLFLKCYVLIFHMMMQLSINI
jgi:hypothetical protein